MSFVDRVIIIIAALFSYESAHNSREAHRHSHELACAINHDALCKYHEGSSHD